MRTNLFTLLALALPAFAQTTVKDTLVKHWKTSADFTLAVARAMPAGHPHKPRSHRGAFPDVWSCSARAG